MPRAKNALALALMSVSSSIPAPTIDLAADMAPTYETPSFFAARGIVVYGLSKSASSRASAPARALRALSLPAYARLSAKLVQPPYRSAGLLRKGCGKKLYPFADLAYSLQPVAVFPAVRFRIFACARQRLRENARRMHHQRNQQPPYAAVAVGKRMYGLEPVVGYG